MTNWIAFTPGRRDAAGYIKETFSLILDSIQKENPTLKIILKEVYILNITGHNISWKLTDNNLSVEIKNKVYQELSKFKDYCQPLFGDI